MPARDIRLVRRASLVHADRVVPYIPQAGGREILWKICAQRKGRAEASVRAVSSRPARPRGVYNVPSERVGCKCGSVCHFERQDNLTAGALLQPRWRDGQGVGFTGRGPHYRADCDQEYGK